MKHGISYLGAAVVTAHALSKSKQGQEGDESFANKVMRDNYNVRSNLVRKSLNHNGGATPAAASHVKANGFFTDIDVESLTVALQEGIDSIHKAIGLAAKAAKKGRPFGLPAEAYGDLDFEAGTVEYLSQDTKTVDDDDDWGEPLDEEEEE
jgi:hypothetical protein